MAQFAFKMMIWKTLVSSGGKTELSSTVPIAKSHAIYFTTDSSTDHRCVSISVDSGTINFLVAFDTCSLSFHFD